jgi:hypothetical protein
MLNTGAVNQNIRTNTGIHLNPKKAGSKMCKVPECCDRCGVGRNPHELTFYKKEYLCCCCRCIDKRPEPAASPWVKFNPEDESTWPKEDGEYMVWAGGVPKWGYWIIEHLDYWKENITHYAKINPPE